MMMRYAIETKGGQWRYFRCKIIARLYVTVRGGKMLGWTL